MLDWKSGQRTSPQPAVMAESAWPMMDDDRRAPSSFTMTDHFGESSSTTDVSKSEVSKRGGASSSEARLKCHQDCIAEFPWFQAQVIHEKLNVLIFKTFVKVQKQLYPLEWLSR